MARRPLLALCLAWGVACSAAPFAPPRTLAPVRTPAPPTSPLAVAQEPAAPEAQVGAALAAAGGPSPTRGPTSEPLACGLFNPMPGGFTAGYPADTGLDLAGMKLPVHAIGAGRVDYAEAGHSLWTGRGDTDLAVRIELDQPLPLEDGRVVTHVWYAHLSELAFEQAEGVSDRRRVEAGELLGVSGKANGMWHLHLGLLLGGDTSQRWGSFLLEDEVREVLCGLGKKARLPALSRADRG